MHSALYRGWLRHRRHGPRPHAFRLPIYMTYLDLAELDEVFRGRWLWSARRAAPARFDRRDHLGPADLPLDTAVRDLVERESGRRPLGPVRLLTHLRQFGIAFNPISLYYCHAQPDGAELQAIVAEVTNTPWRERHWYVLDALAPAAGGAHLRQRCHKRMHVSPFLPMALEYDFRFAPPGERLAVHIGVEAAGDGAGEPARRLFDATLALQRVPIGTASLAGSLLRYPLMTARVLAGIHWQALRLWLKGTPVHDHPDRPAATDRQAPATRPACAAADRPAAPGAWTAQAADDSRTR